MEGIPREVFYPLAALSSSSYNLWKQTTTTKLAIMAVDNSWDLNLQPSSCWLREGGRRYLFLPTPDARHRGLLWFWRDAPEPWWNSRAAGQVFPQ